MSGPVSVITRSATPRHERVSANASWMLDVNEIRAGDCGRVRAMAFSSSHEPGSGGFAPEILALLLVDAKRFRLSDI
jgi:hypothetical protein